MFDFLMRFLFGGNYWNCPYCRFKTSTDIDNPIEVIAIIEGHKAIHNV